MTTFVGTPGISNSYSPIADFSPQDITGAELNDFLTGGPVNDIIRGLAGSDRLSGFTGDDILYGGDGDDRPADANSDNGPLLRGGLGDDTYYGGAGNDKLTETFAGGFDDGGNDLMFGDDGNDIISGGSGQDRIYGGTGNDSILGDGGFTLTANDVIYGGAGDDDISGDGSFTDAGGADQIFGDDGNDKLFGGAGNDLLNGGAGNDRLVGDQGKDRMTGGAGKDVFGYFSTKVDLTKSAANRDTITDFQHKVDKIDLSTVDEFGFKPTFHHWKFIGAGAFTGVKDQLHYVQKGGHTYVEGDTTGDHRADFSIDLLHKIALTKGDFVL